MSDEDINSITASNDSITPKLSYLSAKITVNFNESCLKQDKSDTYTHRAIINIYLVYKSHPTFNNFDPTIESCLLAAAKLDKNDDIDK